MADESPAALRDELRLVEQELAQLRDTAAELRRQVGEATGDDADRASLITGAEEQQAFIGVLEARRQDLRQRLGEG